MASLEKIHTKFMW